MSRLRDEEVELEMVDGRNMMLRWHSEGLSNGDGIVTATKEEGGKRVLQLRFHF